MSVKSIAKQIALIPVRILAYPIAFVISWMWARNKNNGGKPNERG